MLMVQFIVPHYAHGTMNNGKTKKKTRLIFQ